MIAALGGTGGPASVATAAAAAPDGVLLFQVLKLFKTLVAVRTYSAAWVALFLKTWGWRPRYCPHVEMRRV